MTLKAKILEKKRNALRAPCHFLLLFPVSEQGKENCNLEAPKLPGLEEPRSWRKRK